MSNKKNYSLLLKQLGIRIQTEIKKQNLDQKTLSSKCNISQPTISNIINGQDNVSFKKYFALMENLEMDPFNEISNCAISLSSDSSPFIYNNFQSFVQNASENFVYDPDHIVFNGQTGKFHTIFYSTNRNENQFIEGTLHLFSHNNRCLAEMEIIIPNKQNENIDRKFYKGMAVISTLQKAVYILLINDILGEMCFLSYPYNQILRQSSHLECTMAMVVTISSGIDGRLPTAHRMFLSRKELDENSKQLLLGQLLLNKSLIQISLDSFNKICGNKEISSEFIQCFNQHCTHKEYYEIDENHFNALFHDKTNKNTYFHDLCTLRSNSTAPKNNKINNGSINNIFHYITNNQ